MRLICKSFCFVGGNWIIVRAVKRVKDIYSSGEKNSPDSAGRFRHLRTHPFNYPIGFRTHPCNSKDTMRRSRTTQHETLGKVALPSFSVAVPDEIYRLFNHEQKQRQSLSFVS
jgi:hypothetical protein